MGCDVADDLSELRATIAESVRDAMMDDGLFRPKSGGADVPVRLKMSWPAEPTVIQGVSVVQAKPVIEVYLVDVPSLTMGDMFVYQGTIWRVASAPLRPGSGVKWRVDVEKIGTV